jgi:hypothetical protein
LNDSHASIATKPCLPLCALAAFQLVGIIGADNRKALSALRAGLHLHHAQSENPSGLSGRYHRAPPFVSKIICTVICTASFFRGFRRINCGLYGQSGQSSLVHRAASFVEPPQQYTHFLKITRRSVSLSSRAIRYPSMP